MNIFIIIALSLTVVFALLTLASTAFFALLESTRLMSIDVRLSQLQHIVSMVQSAIQISDMEESLNDVLSDVQSNNGNMMPPPGGKIVYRSADGKYTANSPNELLEKMINDPSSGINPNDVESLKRFFERMSLDDDDDESEEWKREK